MCLIALAIGAHPRFPLVVAANRDERFDRPAAALDVWPGGPGLVGGRDLQGGGTWLAVGTRRGRMAMLTNVRDPARVRPDAPSRGSLVPAWVEGEADAATFWACCRGAAHNPYNLLAADFADDAAGRWWWANYIREAPLPLVRGVHGLSNAGLGTPWPKVRRLTAAVERALGLGGDPAERTVTAASVEDALFAALADRAAAPDGALPDTGVGLDRERLLAPAFVALPGGDAPSVYGTRCSTVLVVERIDGLCRASLVERSFDPTGRPSRQRAVRGVRWPWTAPRAGASGPVEDDTDLRRAEAPWRVCDEAVSAGRAPSLGAGCPPR